MKHALVGFLLFIAFTGRTFAATCTYYRNSNRITCGSVTCDTERASWFSGGQLPAGNYYLGEYGYRGNWFKLYRAKVGGGWWDYHTKIPELGCRGGFALHPGTSSRGCITVTDDDCYSRLKDVINRNRAVSFSVYECLSCGRSWWSSSYRCRRGTNTISRLRTTDLQAV